MKPTTLCFLRDDDRICLALKKRGFGEGKLNGVGGKVERGESIPGAAIREIEEEIGVRVLPEDLKSAGNLKFFFVDNPDWHQHMHIFVAKKWKGEPVESDEVAPVWHKVDELPFEKMWIDDPHWLPHVLAGKTIKGEFHFIKSGSEIQKFEVSEV